MMKKKIKRMAIGLLTALSGILIALISFIYFRVDDRVRIAGPPPAFTNNSYITRLDSTTVNSDSISSFVNSIMQKAGVHGMAISIINKNELLYQKYFGMSDKGKNEPFKPGTIFYGASFSKPIFADIVLQLVNDKVIHLDTPLYKYLAKPLPAYETNFFQQVLGSNFIDYSNLTDERHKAFTARMCLSHTTGLPNWRWIENDGKLKILDEPGTRYRYSGEGMFLLQFVIEELTGRDYEDIALEKIFSPLGMTRSSYVWQRGYEGNYARGHDTNGNDLGIPKTDASNAAGSLSTTLEDYTRYFMTVLSKKEERYAEILSPQISIKSRQEFGPNALIDTDDNAAISLSYGLGFGLYETPYGRAFFKEGHGEGWQHYSVGFPSHGTALILMSNSDNAESTFRHLIEFCLGNTYTPWYWEGYIPFDQKDHAHLSDQKTAK